MDEGNAVVQITTHGMIPLSEKGEPKLFELPEGMTLIKMSAVVPGVCNFMDPINAHYSANFILEKEIMTELNTHLTAIGTSGVMSKSSQEFFYGTLARIFRKLDTRIVKGIESQSKKRTKLSQDVDQRAADYVHKLDKNYVVTLFKNKQLVVDKVYQRSNKESFGIQTLALDARTHTYDFKLNRLDQQGRPDLMITPSNKRPLRPKEGEEYEYAAVSLDELLNDLNIKGVKNVVIFDFSCSAFDGTLDDRTVRTLRASILDNGLYGGKNKTRKHRTKNKTRKHRTKNKTRKHRTKNKRSIHKF
jgi:hypothetical protein